MTAQLGGAGTAARPNRLGRIERCIREPRRVADYLGWKSRSRLEGWREARMEARARTSLAAYDAGRIDADRAAFIGRCAGLDPAAVHGFVAEIRADAPLAAHIGHCRDALRRRGVAGNTPEADCLTLYALVRALRPAAIVETGMFYGASAAYMLRAMERNGGGVLHSVDLPAASAEPFGTPLGLGCMVPPELRRRWTVHWGDSREVLPSLLERVGPIDLFFHDSVHTYPFMLWEYSTAWPALLPGGVLASHDVWRSEVFPDFVAAHSAQVRLAERVYNVGIVAKAG